jgi:hypothetical protein
VAFPLTAGADPIDDLPKLGVIDHGRAHVVVRGELAKSARRDALQLADQVIADVERRFTRATKNADPQVTLCVLANDDRYLEVARSLGGEPPSMWGFYQPSRRVAIINYGQSVGNLRHELVHPLLGDDFPGIPSWLNEGIAALYGTARPTKHGFEFLVNYRLRDLQRAIAKHELPTIAELAIVSDTDVYGPRASVYYAMSRYVLLYVERQGKLSELYAKLRDASDADERRDILTHYVDDARFVAWARRLRY